jgi:hypothetical protein
MTENIQARLRTLLIKFTSLAVILAACSTPAADPMDPGNDDDKDDGPDPIYQEVACPAFALTATSGVSLSSIVIGELPAEFDPPFAAHLITADRDSAGFAHIVANESGELELLVPLHPTEPVNGGDVTLIVTDGTLACAPVALSIDPLPEADGEFAAVVDLLQTILTEQAALLETTPEELRTTPFDELPQSLWPLAAAQAVLDDPDNGESLRAIAEGAMGSDVLDLLDRMLEQTDVRAILETPLAPAALLASAQQMAVEGCTPGDIGSSASELDRCMAIAADVKRSTEGISKKVADDIKYVIAVGTKLQLPAVDYVERAFGILFWYIYNEREKTAGTLPSAFTDMTVEVDKPTFLEDEDGPGQVTNAVVHATSTGWDATKAITEALDEGFALAKEATKFGEIPKADELTGQIGNMIKQRLGDLPLDELAIPPVEFGPVDVTNPEWLQMRIVTGNSVMLGSETMYDPARPGTTTLSVRTADGRFGGEGVAEQVGVTVGTLQLQFTPDEALVLPGDSVELTLSVSKSAYPSMVALDDPLDIQGSVGQLTQASDTTHTVWYYAPEEPDPSDRDLIVASHTASSGARGTVDAVDRSAVAVIKFGRLTINPRSGCIDPDSTKSFTATIEGLENQEVEWDASHGAIDANGLYTAPPTPPADRRATIVARSTENQALADSVTVSIGCTCSFTLGVGPYQVMDTPGYRLEYYAYEEYQGAPDVITQILIEQIDGDGGYDATIRPHFNELPNGPGFYGVTVFGSFPVEPPDNGYSDANDGTLKIEVVEYDPGRLLAIEIHGQVMVSRSVGEFDVEFRTEPFDLSMSIRLPEDYEPIGPGAFGHGFVCQPNQ